MSHIASPVGVSFTPCARTLLIDRLISCLTPTPLLLPRPIPAARKLTDAEVAEALLNQLEEQNSPSQREDSLAASETGGAKQKGKDKDEDKKKLFPKAQHTQLLQTVRNLEALRCSQLEREVMRFRPLEVVVGRCRYRDSAQGDARLPDAGICKLFVQAVEPRRVLGCVISGDEAGALMHQVGEGAVNGSVILWSLCAAMSTIQSAIQSFCRNFAYSSC